MVPIDSTTLNHFLFTEPHACTLPFFSMCVRCIHNLQYIFCWKKVNPCQIRIYATSKVSQTGLNDLSAGEKSSASLCDADWEWLMTGGAAKSSWPGRSTFMMTDETKATTSATFSMNTQKTKMSVDLRANGRAALWDDPLSSESIKKLHSDSHVSTRSPEEVWKWILIYLQASVNVRFKRSTELKLKNGDRLSVL